MFLYNKNQSIGEYVVVFPHKEGSYAQTYRVKDKDGKVKFLKLILKEELEFFQYDKSGEIIEVEIAKILKHKNLCTYVDSGSLEKDEHQLEYIVTEYIKGENLNDHIARNKELSQLEIKQIMAALLSALDYIHTLPRPIIHNEVCVENILLDVIGNYNNLKLIDFGASRFLDLKADNQSWHNQNLLYVATERLLGKSCVQSDLFSAGVVLYKLMFGVMPWDVNLAGLTLQQQVQAIIEKRSTPLTVPNIQIMEMDQNLLKIMKDVSDRSCYFLDCLTFYDGNDYYQFFGVSKGTLSKEPKGNESKKYKSNLCYVFIPNNCSKTLAEMSDEERNNRPDNRTSATDEFINWYVNDYKKAKIKSLYKPKTSKI